VCTYAYTLRALVCLATFRIVESQRVDEEDHLGQVPTAGISVSQHACHLESSTLQSVLLNSARALACLLACWVPANLPDVLMPLLCCCMAVAMHQPRETTRNHCTSAKPQVLCWSELDQAFGQGGRCSDQTGTGRSWRSTCKHCTTSILISTTCLPTANPPRRVVVRCQVHQSG
jgi:hypothetical protein